MEFEYVLNDQMSAALKRIDAAAKPLPKDLKAVEDQVNALDRLEKLNGIKKIEDPLKKKHELMKVQRDDLKKAADAQKKYNDDAKKAAEETAKNQKAANAEILGMGAAAIAAAASVGLLAVALAKTAIEYSELHKQSVRKLNFGLGKPGDMKAAEDELVLVKKIRDVTNASESEVTERLRGLLTSGFDKTAAENIITIAEDARSAGDDASQAVIDAYDSIKQSQNDLVNMGKGAFDKATFDKLVKSGAVDRASLLKDIAAAYKTNEVSALRMLQAGSVRGDIAENALTKNLRGRFDKGGAVGTEAKSRADDSIDTQLNRVKNRFGDAFAKVNDKPIINIIKKVGDLLDPDNPRVKRFTDLISKSFEYLGNFVDRITGSKGAGDTAGGMFDKIADRADAFFRVLDKAGDAWDNKISPALDKMMKALAPLLKDLGLTKDTFKNTEDVDAFGNSLDTIATIAVKVIDSISDTIKTIDSLVKSIKEAVDWAGRMKTALTDSTQHAATTTASIGKSAFNATPAGMLLSMLPSFATGLERVPFDNFPAKLHKDERVLTAGEARMYERSIAPAPPQINLGAGALGGGGKSIGDISVTVIVQGGSAQGGGSAGLAQEIGDEVRTQLLELLESLGYQTGALAT